MPTIPPSHKTATDSTERRGARARGRSRESAIGPERALRESGRLGPGGVLALQRAAGNRAVVGLLQAKPATVRPDEPARVHEAAGLGIGGASGKLPHLEAVQRSFGRHDVTRVVAHTGAQATAGAQAMGAAAFTMGDRVAFAGSADLRTAAHEAAHVVQQRAGVQLTGGVGEAGDAYERHADQVADKVVRGESAEALLDRYAGSSSPVSGGAVQRRQVQWGQSTIDTRTLTREQLSHKIVEVQWRERDMSVMLTVTEELEQALAAADYQLPHTQAQVGQGITATMDAVNGPRTATTGVWYEDNYRRAHPGLWQDHYVGGHAPAVFHKLGAMDWQLQPGNSASAALAAWFAGLTIAECASVLVAIHLDALRRLLGDEKFDARFGVAGPTAPSIHLLRICGDHSLCIPTGLLEGAGETDEGQPALSPGAKYYFKNHDDYLFRHPTGTFQGENAIYIGVVGGLSMFAGFGVPRASYRRMFEILRDAYNAPRTESDYRFILHHETTDVPVESVEQAHASFSYEQIYTQWRKRVHKRFRNAEAAKSLEQIVANPGGAGIPGQGVQLNLREIEKTKHT